MPPRIRGARAALAGSAAPGRQSTRIAAQMEAAQQAAGQPAADEPASAPEPEPVIAAGTATAADDDASHDTDASLNDSPGDNGDNVDVSAAPESPVPPPSSRGGRGAARGPGEQYARRGVPRVSRDSMPVSVQSPDSSATPASFAGTQSDARGESLSSCVIFTVPIC